MNLIENVWDLAREVCTDLKYIYLRPETIKGYVAPKIKRWMENRRHLTAWDRSPFLKNNKDVILYELIANSVNYCFWYGKANLRPNGSEAGKMYSLLDEAWKELEKKERTATFGTDHRVEIIIELFKQKLITERFPLLDKRIFHLNELKENKGTPWFIDNNPEMKMEELLEHVVRSFSGYSQDLFLKRAVLLLLQINRRTGLFNEGVGKLPIAADYQIPKMLEYLNCFKYENSLKRKVVEGTLIPEGSREEIEIRAASILVCSMLAEEIGCTCNDIDSYLWTERKTCTENFHLTVTSNY